MVKRSLKSSASSATDVREDPEHYSIWSNGKDTPKATTLGNRPRKFMPQISFKPTTASAHWNA
jgi:hypothetical protein